MEAVDDGAGPFVEVDLEVDEEPLEVFLGDLASFHLGDEGSLVRLLRVDPELKDFFGAASLLVRQLAPIDVEDGPAEKLDLHLHGVRLQDEVLPAGQAEGSHRYFLGLLISDLNGFLSGGHGGWRDRAGGRSLSAPVRPFFDDMSGNLGDLRSGREPFGANLGILFQAHISGLEDGDAAPLCLLNNHELLDLEDLDNLGDGHRLHLGHLAQLRDELGHDRRQLPLTAGEVVERLLQERDFVLTAYPVEVENHQHLQEVVDLRVGTALVEVLVKLDEDLVDIDHLHLDDCQVEGGEDLQGLDDQDPSCLGDNAEDVLVNEGRFVEELEENGVHARENGDLVETFNDAGYEPGAGGAFDCREVDDADFEHQDLVLFLEVEKTLRAVFVDEDSQVPEPVVDVDRDAGQLAQEDGGEEPQDLVDCQGVGRVHDEDEV